MKQLLPRVGWSLMAILALGLVLTALPPYLSLNPVLSRIRLNPAVALQFPILVIHATTGGLALLLGPLQFLGSLRAKYPLVHRTMGRIYLISVLVGGLAALFSALSSTGGFAAQVGFSFLAVIWLYSAYRAYAAIRQGHIQLHRVWMTRNYALTFAAVILRFWLAIGAFILHFPFNQVYTSSAWLSWILPLLVVEWFINQRLVQLLAVKKELLPGQKEVTL
jgi:uncharacterized membrane protein